MSKISFNKLGITVFCAVFLLSTLYSCRSNRDASKKPCGKKKPQYVVKNLEKNQFDFKWLSMKADTEVESLDKTTSFKSAIRIRKDSAIWVSISPLLGIEVVRALITVDSVKFIIKEPGNKRYFIGNYDYLNEKYNVDLDYFMLQNMLVGNAIGFEREEKYKSEEDESQYLLTLKSNKRLIKALKPNDDETTSLDSTFSDQVKEKRLQKALEKSTDRNYLQKYWVNCTTFKASRIIIDDLVEKRVLEVEYDNHKDIEEQLMPHHTQLKIADLKGKFWCELKYSKVRLNKPQKLPFKITDKYEQIVH